MRNLFKTALIVAFATTLLFQFVSPARTDAITIFIDGMDQANTIKGMKHEAVGQREPYLMNSQLATELKAKDQNQVNIKWTGDISNIKEWNESAVEDLKNVIKVFKTSPKTKDEPINIVAHSHGTVIAYRALEELQKDRPDIKISSLTTMGSPLGHQSEAIPSIIEKAGVQGSNVKEQLAQVLKQVLPEPKPLSNVNNWANLWADNDNISGQIKIEGVKNIQIDRDKDTIEREARKIISSTTAGSTASAIVMNPRIKSVDVWHEAYYKGVHEGEINWNIPKDYSDKILPPTSAVAVSHASQKTTAQPAPSAKETDKAKTEQPKPVAPTQEATTTTQPSIAKKETPSASPAEKSQPITVTPTPASPITEKSDAPKISEITKGGPAPKTQQTLDETGKTLGKIGGTLKQLPQSIKTQSPSQKQETLQTLDALKQKLMQLSDVLKQMQNESAKKQAISTAIPAAKTEAIRITNLPPTLPPGLPMGKVADKDNLTGRNQIAGQDKLTPTKVEFTQTFDGLFTQSADAVGSRYGSHSGSLTDGTRVNVKGDSRAGDFTGSFSGRTIAEPGYTPATHNDSAFSGSSVGKVSARGFKEGDLKGTMTVTVPAGAQTVRVTGDIKIKTDGSLSMPSYSGPVTVNATGEKVGTMSGSWSQSKTR